MYLFILITLQINFKKQIKANHHLHEAVAEF